jgi:transposase
VDVTALYCCLDDFCQVFGDWEAHRLIPSQATRERPGKLSRSETLFTVVLSHLSASKHFKAFHHHGTGQQHRAGFGDLPHCDRFVSLMPRLFAPLTVLLHSLSGEPTGIYFAGPTKLAVCHNRRVRRHRVCDGLAARGKASMGEAAGGSIGPADRWRGSGGWFYGLKPHVVVSHTGQVVALRITPGNTADSTVLDEMTRHLAGKPCADKGYVGRALFAAPWQRGPHLITSIRRNMRNHPMPLADKVTARERLVIETVLDTLKSEMGLGHSRHGSVMNAMVHVLSRLVACASRPGKPSVSLTRQHIKAYP